MDFCQKGGTAHSSWHCRGHAVDLSILNLSRTWCHSFKGEQHLKYHREAARDFHIYKLSNNIKDFFLVFIFTSSPTPAAFISGFKSYVATFGEGTIDLVSPSNCFSTPPLKKKVTCAYFSVSMDATKPSEEKKRTALHIFM